MFNEWNTCPCVDAVWDMPLHQNTSITNLESYLTYNSKECIYSTAISNDVNRLLINGEEDILKRLMLKNPMLFKDFFNYFCYKKENMTRWCIDNKDKWTVCDGLTVDDIIYDLIFCNAGNMSLYINDIKNLIDSQRYDNAWYLQRGFDRLCLTKYNDNVFDLLYPLVIPSPTNLNNVIQKGNSHKFNKILDHPKFKYHTYFKTYCSYAIQKLITGDLYSRECLEKLLGFLPEVGEENVIFNRHSINYINSHPEMDWVKDHPKWSLKGLEKRSVREFITYAMKECLDNQIKRVLEMGIEIVGDMEETDEEKEFDDLDNLIYKYK